MLLTTLLNGIQSSSNSNNEVVPFQRQQQDELCINSSTNDKILVEVASRDEINSTLTSVDQQQNGNTGKKNCQLTIPLN